MNWFSSHHGRLPSDETEVGGCLLPRADRDLLGLRRVAVRAGGAGVGAGRHVRDRIGARRTRRRGVPRCRSSPSLRRSGLPALVRRCPRWCLASPSPRPWRPNRPSRCRRRWSPSRGPGSCDRRPRRSACRWWRWRLRCQRSWLPPSRSVATGRCAVSGCCPSSAGDYRQLLPSVAVPEIVGGLEFVGAVPETESTFQLRIAGVASRFPAASVAATSRVWLPWLREE